MLISLGLQFPILVTLLAAIFFYFYDTIFARLWLSQPTLSIVVVLLDFELLLLSSTLMSRCGDYFPGIEIVFYRLTLSLLNLGQTI